MAVRARIEAVFIEAVLALALAVPLAPAWAQDDASPDRPSLPMVPPAPFKPDGSKPDASKPDGAMGQAGETVPDTWIFSGALQSSHESFSGTLVTGNAESQFELKLAGGATCTGGSLKGEVGLVRLSEITCSDDRTMRALFVPQGGDALRVFGHVGEERFSTSAHLLGTEAIPDKPQTTAPKAPAGTPVPPGPKQGPG